MDPIYWIVTISLFTLALGQAQVIANTPTNVRQCSTTILTWSSGKIPYNVRVNTRLSSGGGGAPLVAWDNVETTNVQWLVNMTAGINAVLSVQDAEGFLGMSAGFDILPGTTDCMVDNGAPLPPPLSPSPANPAPSESNLAPNTPIPSESAPSNPILSPAPAPLSSPAPVPSNDPSAASGGSSSFSSVSNPVSRTQVPSTAPSVFNSISSPGPSSSVRSSPRSSSSAVIPAVITTVVTVPCFLLMGFGIVCWRRRKRRRTRHDEENRSRNFSLPDDALERTPIVHHSSFSSTPSSQHSASAAMAEYSPTPPVHATTAGVVAPEIRTDAIPPISRVSASTPVATITAIERQQETIETGVFSRDPADPSLIRLDPNARYARAALRYQAKLYRELGLDSQPQASTPSTPQLTSDAPTTPNIPEQDMREIVEGMRMEIEQLRARQEQAFTLSDGRIQSPPPPSYYAGEKLSTTNWCTL